MEEPKWVIYILILKQSPVGLSYTAGISKEMTRFLQEIALESTKGRFNWF
jgi:hypothetical protein